MFELNKFEKQIVEFVLGNIPAGTTSLQAFNSLQSISVSVQEILQKGEQCRIMNTSVRTDTNTRNGNR